MAAGDGTGLAQRTGQPGTVGGSHDLHGPIEWTGETRATFARRLMATDTLAIRITQPAQVDTASSVMEESAGKEAMKAVDQRRAGQLAGSVDEFDARAQGFTRGLWFDFMADGSTRHRCRGTAGSASSTRSPSCRGRWTGSCRMGSAGRRREGG